MAGGQWPGLIPVWDLATRRQVACLSNHTAWVSSLTFSRDGMRLASASADQQIVRWDASTWRPSATLKGHRGEIWALAISPEGELLATGGKDKTVRLWSTSPQPAEQNELSAQRVWVSPSGRFCVLSFVDSSGAITNRELVVVATLARRSLGPSPRMRIAWSTNSDACGRRSFDGATVQGRMVTITVRVEGEHQSPQEYQLPYGTRIGELLKRIEYSERSDLPNLQLFRLSVKDRQKQVLQTSLKSLEAAVLTARSGTNDESTLRANEAALVLQWVERAKEIEPSGQVLIAQASLRDELLLENGDTVRVPVKDGLVLVGGEVMFPNTLPFESELSVQDYIKRAGGFTQNADASKVIIAHRDGSFIESTEGFFSKAPPIRAGDHILVLPRIDVKYRQIAKALTQMLVQYALLH